MYTAEMTSKYTAIPKIEVNKITVVVKLADCLCNA